MDMCPGLSASARWPAGLSWRTGFISVVLAGLLLALGAIPTQAEKRVALIIGNNAYKHLTPLNNPVPDATALAALLRQHGFLVAEKHNLDLGAFQVALDDFRSDSFNADVVLVYYAGHGMQLENRDVLAPVDLEYQCPKEGEPARYRRAVTLEEFFDKLGSERAKTVVLIDACRNAPFARCPKRAAEAGSGLTFRGLVRPGPQPRSLLIANATLPGFLTEDGEAGRRSPFARALLARLRAHPEMLFRDVLDLTARDVSADTGGLQVPEVIIRGGTPQVCLRGDGCGPSEAARQWTRLNKNSIAELDAFIRQHPASPEAAYAAEMRSALETAERAQEALRLAEIQRQQAHQAAGSSTVVDGASLKRLQDGHAKWTALSEPVRGESQQAYIARMKQLVALAQHRPEPHWIRDHWAIGVWFGDVKAAKLGPEGLARALNVANVNNDGSVFGGWTASSSRAFGLGAAISVQGDRVRVRTQQFSIVTLQKFGNDRLVGTFKLKNGKTYPITLVRQ
jgi:uncharacterized caspase-like protein